VTELDLSLKAASRRLFWRMGFSTKIDVPLRAVVPKASGGQRGKTKSQYETYTDLDVLGIQISSDLRVVSTIADCKTSAKGSTERMFWIRGVADFFSADDAYMVRSKDVTSAARQLAARLAVGVLTQDDLAVLESHYESVGSSIGVMADYLFVPSSIAEYRRCFLGLDRRLHPLREYQEFDFWVYEEHRNLQQLVAHLTKAAKQLDPTHPTHQALFFESAWLYSLSISKAVHHVRRTHVTDIDTSLREYLFGGQLGLREKQQLANVLRVAAGKNEANSDEGVFPSYYGALLELASRVLRRPTHVTNVLRYAEWAAESRVARDPRSAAGSFGEAFDDIAAKLLSDVCGFLVSTAGLDADFRVLARGLFAPLAKGTPLADLVADATLTSEDGLAKPVVQQTLGEDHLQIQEPLPIVVDTP